MLKYKPETHEYFWGDVPVDSVNQILKAEGVIPDFNFPAAEYKCQLGSYVHKAIKLYFGGKLDENSLSGPVKEYFEGAKKFIEDFAINPFEVEKFLYSQKHRFAGTPDFWDTKLYDWKCSCSIYPHYELTMGAYALLVEEFQKAKPTETILIQLKPFDYKLHTINPNCKAFLALRYAYQWKKERGLYGKD